MKTEEEYKKEIMELIKEADSIPKRTNISNYTLVERSEKDSEKIHNLSYKNCELIVEALNNKLYDKFLYFDGKWGTNASPSYFLDWTPNETLIAFPMVYAGQIKNNIKIRIYSNFYALRYARNDIYNSEIHNNETFHTELLTYNNIIDFIKKKSIDEFFSFFDVHTISEEKFIEKYNVYLQEYAQKFVTNLKHTQTLNTEAFKIKNNLL